jgi:hypothetical protein
MQVDAERGSEFLNIELDVFSGRKNPSWTISGTPARSLRESLSRLNPSPAPPEPTHLGYRGFVVEAVEGRWRVFAGSVYFRSAAAQLVSYSDDQRIEEELLSQAELLGHSNLVERFRRH